VYETVLKNLLIEDSVQNIDNLKKYENRPPKIQIHDRHLMIKDVGGLDVHLNLMHTFLGETPICWRPETSFTAGPRINSITKILFVALYTSGVVQLGSCLKHSRILLALAASCSKSRVLLSN
jgi:hypothetical protein